MIAGGFALILVVVVAVLASWRYYSTQGSEDTNQGTAQHTVAQRFNLLYSQVMAV